jgi:hypothetical protein
MFRRKTDIPECCPVLSNIIVELSSATTVDVVSAKKVYYGDGNHDCDGKKNIMSQRPPSQQGCNLDTGIGQHNIQGKNKLDFSREKVENDGDISS